MWERMRAAARREWWTRKQVAVALGGLAVAVAVAAPIVASAHSGGRYVTGDFHTHTYLTDGSKTQLDVVHNAFDVYGLDWMANSEHGGKSSRDAFGNSIASTYRWITLKTQSWPIIRDLRPMFPDKLLVQGVEWNVPTHEHASVAIVTDEPTAVSDFEYMFDQSDNDTSRVGMSKDNTTAAGAVRGAAWLQANYPTSSYFLVNHPSRKLKYTVADFRDFNNAAPDVAFGFEGVPGHQKEPGRGGYDNPFADATMTAKARTYGGADYMVAKVGGLWDALLGEGRHFWMFVNSDFHNTDGDFWPGEYAKSHTYVTGSGLQALVDGMRSGNSFAVHGDLIDDLRFTVGGPRGTAAMGGTLVVDEGDDVKVTVRFHVPSSNNNGDRPSVDHIDLIKGDVTGMTTPGTPAYSDSTNPTARVAKRFTSPSWTAARAEGRWFTVTYRLDDVDADTYIRLRGTNLGTGVVNETDAAGNPLMDDVAGPNDPAKAWADLWFYSNPIFIDVR